MQNGAEIVIADQAAPCRIRISETDITLRADVEGTRPDPGRSILRDRRGRIYTANASGFPGTIALWSSSGEYVRTIASPGQGPGELSTQGDISIYLDSQDRLHVRDGSLSWSVFTPEHEFVRRVPSAVMGGLRGSTAILDDGRAISGAFYYSMDKAHYFQVADSLGKLDGAISPLPAPLEASSLYLTRAVAYGGGETFWAGPAVYRDGYSPMGYRLEEWSLTGELVRTIRREVPWYPLSWPEPTTRPEGATQPKPAMSVNGLHIDDEGILLVFMAGASDQWRPLTFREREELSESEIFGMYTVIVEALDTRTGLLLASDTVSDPNHIAFFGNLTPRSRFGAWHTVDEAMLPAAHLAEYTLVTR